MLIDLKLVSFHQFSCGMHHILIYIPKSKQNNRFQIIIECKENHVNSFNLHGDRQEP